MGPRGSNGRATIGHGFGYWIVGHDLRRTAANVVGQEEGGSAHSCGAAEATPRGRPRSESPGGRPRPPRCVRRMMAGLSHTSTAAAGRTRRRFTNTLVGRDYSAECKAAPCSIRVQSDFDAAPHPIREAASRWWAAPSVRPVLSHESVSRRHAGSSWQRPHSPRHLSSGNPVPKWSAGNRDVARAGRFG
jgi:hypothetical protein